MGSRILVTGVAGFIGSNLAVRLLAAGHHVVGIDNLAYGVKAQIPDGVEFHSEDIRSEKLWGHFQKVDVVFHLAAKNDLIACQQGPVETMEINVGGTANVLDAAGRAGVKKVVLASSSALEEGEARLDGFYAISKITAESLAVGFKSAYGVEFVALRYFNAYGPRQDYRRKNPPVISAFIINVLKKKQPVLFEGFRENKRDFIYVDDINDFHLQAINDDRLNGRLFRLGSGVSKSMGEVWDAVKQVAGSDLDPVIMPRSAHDTPTATLADISAASEMGWKPKTLFEDGIREQYRTMLQDFEAGKIG